MRTINSSGRFTGHIKDGRQSSKSYELHACTHGSNAPCKGGHGTSATWKLGTVCVSIRTHRHVGVGAHHEGGQHVQNGVAGGVHAIPHGQPRLPQSRPCAARDPDVRRLQRCGQPRFRSGRVPRVRSAHKSVPYRDITTASLLDGGTEQQNQSPLYTVRVTEWDTHTE